MFHFSLSSHAYPSVHFIGIGGVSMSGIAELLHTKRYQITGSDRSENFHTKHLRSVGIPITIGQSADNIKNQSLFVYTDAIPMDNTELVAARATGRPCVTRGQFLGALMRNYQHSIAVSGSHGKSTTTSIITKILLGADADSTILLGGALDEIGGNMRSGSSEYFLAEACEYKGNIRYYFPQLAIVLNIDEDHLDYYRDLDDIIDTFAAYMDNLSADAKAILNIDDENTRKLLRHVAQKAVTFGIDNDDAMYNAIHIVFDDLGHPSFDLRLPDGSLEPFHLNIIGRYNVYNSVAAIAATHQTGLPISLIRQGVENYRPLHRRMEIVGTFHDATVMTDYGHHPKEIQSTLDALSEHKPARLICVFQPHTYSRTRTLMDQFAESFYSADEVVVTEIMGAREVDDGSVHATELVDRLLQNHVPAVYCKTFEDAEHYLAARVHYKDLILTTGCGNIDELAYQMAQHRPALA